MDPDGFRRLRPVGEHGRDIMAAVDESGGVSKLIIADISADDAWLSMPAAAAPTLESWR